MEYYTICFCKIVTFILFMHRKVSGDYQRLAYIINDY